MIIRLKGIKRVKARGSLYFYHRATGERIRALPNTAEFAAEVAALDARAAAPKTIQPPGTWPWIVERYRASQEWKDLAPRTRADYQRIFDYLVDPEGDGSKPGLSNVPLVKITTALLYTARDKAAEKHGRRWGNYIVERISAVWNWALRRSLIDQPNPAKLVDKIRRPKSAPKANRPWSDEELEAVLAEAKPGLAVATALGAFTGLREGDVLTLPWSAYDGASITTRQGKTGDEVWIPVHSRLKLLLDGIERNGDTIVVGQRGHSYTVDGFRTSFFKLLRSMETEGKISKGLTFHGLRHTVATKLADAGADDRTIMSVTGHRSVAMVQRYTALANQKRRATRAMKMLDSDQETP